MKTVISLILSMVLVGCGASSSHQSNSVNRVDSKLKIVDKPSGLKLADNSVDGMFFGRYSFSAVSIQLDKPMYYVLGISQAELSSECQLPMIKQGSDIPIPTCAQNNNLALTEDDEYATPAQLDVDFFVLSLEAVSLLKNNIVYTADDVTRIWAPKENLLTKDLPVQVVSSANDGASSFLKIVYANRNAFPTPLTFNFVVGMESKIEDASIVLTESQEKKLKIALLSATSMISNSTSSSDTYSQKVYVIPTEPVVITNLAGASLSIINNPYVVKEEVPVTEEEQNNSSYANCAGFVLSDRIMGAKCWKRSTESCPANSTRTFETMQYQYNWTVESPNQCGTAAVVTTINQTGLTLTDGTTSVSAKDASFTMSLDFSSLLTSDSKLEGSEPHYKFNEISGVPFGSSLSVVK